MLHHNIIQRRRWLRSSRSLALFGSLAVQSAALHIAVITGTTRTEGPPKPVLGPRVANFVCRILEERGNTVHLVDARHENLGLLDKPAFAYSPRSLPPHLAKLQATLQEADAYVTITPEYNHSPSPALLNILNHFGSSVFSFKPSAIVSYSAGQWGGTRAAIALRPILSELGCLPVSAMIHIPKAQDVLREDGTPHEASRWDSYPDRCFSQLEWWAEAAREQKTVCDPFTVSPSFQTDPAERNAPN